MTPAGLPRAYAAGARDRDEDVDVGGGAAQRRARMRKRTVIDTSAVVDFLLGGGVAKQVKT
jgi:hypothetical protein